MKLVHLSDVHVDTTPVHGIDPVARLEAALDHVLGHHRDAERIVITGDLAHRGDEASYRVLRAVLARAGLADARGLDPRLRLLIGNHDDRSAFVHVFPEIRLDPYGSVASVDPVSAGRFVYLDTQSPGTHAGRLTPTRMGWLADALARAREDGVGAWLFMHHNPAPVGVPDADRIGLVEWRELAELLSGFPGTVRHVFFGHCHFTLAGSIAGVPISAPRSTSHPCWPDIGGPDSRMGVGPLEPDYAVALIEPSHTIVHAIDFARAAAVEWVATGSTVEEIGAGTRAREEAEPSGA